MMSGLVGWLKHRGDGSEGATAVAESPPSVPETVRNTVISVINQKGGCGKTTTAVNLSACIAQRGFRVLLIDLDPQGHSTLGLGIRGDSVTRSVYDLLMNPETRLDDVVRTTPVERLMLAPSNIQLSSAQVDLIGVEEHEARLRTHMERAAGQYHFTLVDCPPSLNLLSVNALTSSHCLLIPIQPQYYSLDGMRELFKTIDIVRERFNPQLRVLGILPTMVDRRLKIEKEMLETIRTYFKDQVFETAISMNVKLMEAPIVGEPVCVYAPKSAGAKEYGRLAEEVINLVRETGRL